MGWDEKVVKQRLADGAKLSSVEFDGKKVSDIAEKVLDLLRRETGGPLEGYAVLTVLVEGFRKSYGIYADQVFVIPKDSKSS